MKEKKIRQKTKSMKISRTDTIDIGKFAIFGFAIAGGLQLFNVVVNRKVGHKLSVDTEELHNHRELLILFGDLESKVKEIAEIAFVRAVDAADELLFLSVKLQTGKVEPVPTDRDRAYTHFKRAQHNLRALIDQVTLKQTSQQAAEVIMVITKIGEILEDSLSNVMIKTNNIL